MKLAIFSDVHANLEALEAFSTDYAGSGAARLFFLGDSVGYGPCPNECIELLVDLPACELLLGNHDSAAREQSAAIDMSPVARQAIAWTRNQLTARSLQVLFSLHTVRISDDLSFSHASPHEPELWPYLTSQRAVRPVFAHTPHRISFVGHTHIPRLIELRADGSITFSSPEPGETVHLHAAARWIVNCGSIGQPRDNNPDGCYCLYDTESGCLQFRRLAYDHAATAARIRRAGLPGFLAERLAHGI